MDVSRETPDVTTKPKCYDLTSMLVPRQALKSCLFTSPAPRRGKRRNVPSGSSASARTDRSGSDQTEAASRHPSRGARAALARARRCAFFGRGDDARRGGPRQLVRVAQNE